jgi:hypothetical protein
VRDSRIFVLQERQRLALIVCSIFFYNYKNIYSLHPGTEQSNKHIIDVCPNGFTPKCCYFGVCTFPLHFLYYLFRFQSGYKRGLGCC